MIRITSKREGFRRCGIAHSKTPTEYPIDKFSKEELKALEAEPNLVVEVAKPKPSTTQKTETEVIEAAGKLQQIPQLKKLAEGEKRQPVLDAIAARIKVLEARPAAADVIKAIKAAESVEDLDKALGDDDRAGVRKEADKKRKELKKDSGK